MAQRRMFSLKVIDTDMFLDMPQSTRLLYYELCMRADDDGFVSSPKKIIRMTGCSEDDMKILNAKQYVIPFETGVCVIKHWRIHNLIRSDRYTETIYKNEKSLLEEDNNSYVIPNVIPSVNQMEPQVRLGKDSIGKDNTLVETKASTDKYSDDSIEVALSELLYSKMLINNHKAKRPNIQSWAVHIDRLLRIDNYTQDEVQSVIEWCQQDSFWKSNILSTSKLRDKFPTLLIKSKGNDNSRKSLTERNMDVYSEFL